MPLLHIWVGSSNEPPLPFKHGECDGDVWPLMETEYMCALCGRIGYYINTGDRSALLRTTIDVLNFVEFDVYERDFD